MMRGSEIVFDVTVVFISLLMWISIRFIYIKNEEPSHLLETITIHDDVKSKVIMPPTMNDTYEDLMQIVLDSESISKYGEVVKQAEDFLLNPILGDLMNWHLRENATNFMKFHHFISKRDMYPENCEVVDSLVNEMSEMEIDFIEKMTEGYQMKLSVDYANGMFGVFKPSRHPLDYQIPPNIFFFDDVDRPKAEIAAFELDKALGFRRAVPVAGRTLNIMKDIFHHANERLMEFIYRSPANNTCFYGTCRNCFEYDQPYCGNPDSVEGSIAVYIPVSESVKMKEWKHPWRRSYNTSTKSDWESDSGYCDKIRNEAPYDSGSRLLDLIDLSIFDFLIGNMNRRYYETFAIFGDDAFPLHIDQGHAFGMPFLDEITILAPMLQCCLIRATTLEKLLIFHNGPKHLSEIIREALKNNPVAPILWEPHLEALDRRVVIILQGVRDCVEKVYR